MGEHPFHLPPQTACAQGRWSTGEGRSGRVLVHPPAPERRDKGRPGAGTGASSRHQAPPVIRTDPTPRIRHAQLLSAPRARVGTGSSPLSRRHSLATRPHNKGDGPIQTLTASPDGSSIQNPVADATAGALVALGSNVVCKRGRDVYTDLHLLRSKTVGERDESILHLLTFFREGLVLWWVSCCFFWIEVRGGCFTTPHPS